MLIKNLSLPIIVAPMFLVSSPSLVLESCRGGVLGSFPAHATRSSADLENWLMQIERGAARMRDEGVDAAPYAVNLVVHHTNSRFKEDMLLCERRRVPIILSSKGAPGEVADRVHGYGGIVLHDVASARHGEKAVEQKVDGLIAVAGGAGGHTGTLNPFSLVNELRQFYSGPLVLGGGMSTGKDVLAAQVMGADYAYIGTRFLATQESAASEEYKNMVLDAKATDILLSDAIDGAPANWLAESLVKAGINVSTLRKKVFGEVEMRDNVTRWRDIWSAGHAVGTINDIPTVAQLVERLKSEYLAAKQNCATI